MSSTTDMANITKQTYMVDRTKHSNHVCQNHQNSFRIQPTPSDCVKESFKTISNSGYDGIYSLSCMWISIVQFLIYINPNLSYLTPHILRNQVSFPNKSIMFEIDDANPNSLHSLYLQKICNMYNINISIFYINYSKTTNSCWIGNPAFNYSDNTKTVPKQNQCTIAYNPEHFELIVTKTKISNAIDDNYLKQFKLNTYNYIPSTQQQQTSQEEWQPTPDKWQSTQKEWQSTQMPQRHPYQQPPSYQLPQRQQPPPYQLPHRQPQTSQPPSYQLPQRQPPPYQLPQRQPPPYQLPQRQPPPYQLPHRQPQTSQPPPYQLPQRQPQTSQPPPYQLPHRQPQTTQLPHRQPQTSQPQRSDINLKTSKDEDKLAKYTRHIELVRNHISKCEEELSLIYLTARENAHIEIDKSLNDNQITQPQDIINLHVQKYAHLILSIETTIDQQRVILQQYICKIEELVK
jgi:hypothetical protein